MKDETLSTGGQGRSSFKEHITDQAIFGLEKKFPVNCKGSRVELEGIDSEIVRLFFPNTHSSSLKLLVRKRVQNRPYSGSSRYAFERAFFQYLLSEYDGAKEAHENLPSLAQITNVVTSHSHRKITLRQYSITQ